MLVYEAIVRALEGIGVGAAFGGPGESNSGIMLALRDSRRLRGIVTRNEQAASFMACGYAMFSDRLGVCFATAGPGAFNLISGLSVALTDSYPVLAITGYSSLEWQGKGSLNETSGLGRTPDSQQMLSATTKRSFLLKDIADTCDVLEEAVNLAFEGRPGPVHISVAEDLTDPRLEVPNYHDIRLDVKPVQASEAEIETVAGVLVRALRDRKRVVVLAGFGAVRSGAGRALQRLAERYQIPVLTTMDGKGIIAEEHPLAVGLFCDTGHESAWSTFLDADIVLAIGNSFMQHATFDFRQDLFEGKQLIQINIDPSEIGKVYRAGHALVSDAKAAVEGLLEAMSRQLEPSPPKKYPAQDYDTERIFRLRQTLHPGQMTQSMSKLLPENAVVLGDAGAHSVWLAYYLELCEGQSFRKPGRFGPMAGHTNGAIGVKAAFPERTVVVGCGDGAYLMSGFELLTAVQYNLPVIWVVFDDGEFKLIKLYQLAAFQDSALVEFNNPDYVAYAKACGADGYRVNSRGQFERAFKKALASGRPTIIDAKITRLALPNYSSSPEGVLEGLWERLRAMLHRPPRRGMLSRYWQGVRRRFGRE